MGVSEGWFLGWIDGLFGWKNGSISKIDLDILGWNFLCEVVTRAHSMILAKVNMPLSEKEAYGDIQVSSRTIIVTDLLDRLTIETS